MAKGIRVNLLAKSLGVPSKLIVQRLKAMEVGKKVPNHMSTMSLSLAAAVREWVTDQLNAKSGDDNAFSAKTIRKAPNAVELIKVSKPLLSSSAPVAAKVSMTKGDSIPTQKPPGKAQQKEDARIELLKTLQGDFESHLAAAKKAERGGRRVKKDRFVRAAIKSQVAVVDGYLSLLYERYWPLPDRKRINKREKLERLCKFASQKSGSRIDPLQFHLIVFRDIFSHPAIEKSHPTIKGLVLSAAAIDENMPAPTEVEAEEIRINEFFKKLQSLLPNC